MAEYITLNNGLKMPPIGLGTYATKDPENLTKQAIDIGYRLIDTAFVYQNEADIGKAIKAKLQDGTVKREDLFVISKLWNTKHRPEVVEPEIKGSLKDLGLDYVDLYLMHWPLACKDTENPFCLKLEEDDVSPEETWKAMEKCVKAGYAKSIGLSNFNSKQIERILSIAEIKPVVNEIECNPYCNQRKLIQFCKERGVEVIAYSPFWNGNLCTPEIADSLQKTCPGETQTCLGNDTIRELAEKYDKTPGQIVLRYLIQLGTIPIPKTDKVERLKQNIDIFNFKLSSEDEKKLDSVNKNLRCCPYTPALNFKEYPFNIEY